jgi:hypothetical protein
MAPEVLRGEAQTPAGDVYALAVLMVEILTDQRDIRALRALSVRADSVFRPPVRVADLIANALNPMPQHRPKASVVREELGRAAAEIKGARDLRASGFRFHAGRILADRCGLARYERCGGAIVADLAGLYCDGVSAVNTIFMEVEALARPIHPSPWLVVACHDLSFATPELAAYFGERCAAARATLPGVVCCAAENPITRAYLRAQSVKQRAVGVQAKLFGSVDEALSAVERVLKSG